MFEPLDYDPNLDILTRARMAALEAHGTALTAAMQAQRAADKCRETIEQIDLLLGAAKTAKGKING